MKWLFAVLVALNLIVFGGMVIYRMTGKQTQTAQAPLEGGTHELARPASLNGQAAPETAPDWVALPENNDTIPEPESEEAKAAREKAEREAKAKEKEKKEREEKAKREKEAKEKAALAENELPSSKSVGNQCVSTASVSLDEDDYHRLKGMLNKWPHAATRSVEKRAAKKGESRVSKTFRVLVPTDGDAMAQLETLNSKGFTGVLYNGEISMGVTRSKSSAQIIISRLAGAGFGGAHILEQEDHSTVSEGTLSVARMHVTFMSVDERGAKDLQELLGRYGKVSLKACR